MSTAENTSPKTRTIRILNDYCRQTFTGCTVTVTAAVCYLEPDPKANVLEGVQNFNAFDEGNDPHHEHDMAFFEVNGGKYLFKFDSYAPDMQQGSDDPPDV